jgi:hypothetical protein
MQGAMAFGAAGTLPAEGKTAPKGALKLKLGVLSDIHITPRNNVSRWEQALRAFDKWGADGVLVCGDLADYGTAPELKHVADTWFKVFPGGRRSDGQPIANLLHYGDHDCSGYTYRHCKSCVEDYPDEEAMKKLIIPLNDRKAIWENCFQEEWAPIMRKTVKGYDFILSHFSKGEPGNAAGNNVPGLERFMAGQDLDPAKPFFYSQHRVLRNTAGGRHVWGQDDGKVRDLFASRYPNCVAFCGHKHLTCAEELSIWQGEFTCLAVPSLSYCVTLAGRENGYSLADKPYVEPYYMMRGISHGCQGYFVSVYENAIDVRRWNFSTNAAVGPDWSVPLPAPGERKYSHERRAETDPAPVFAPDAKIRLAVAKDRPRDGEDRDMVVVSFPPAAATAETPRANDYEVQLENRRADVVRVLSTRRVYSPGYSYGFEKDVSPVRCNFPVGDVPVNDWVRFVARPVNSFSRKGGEIACDWFRFNGRDIPGKLA